MKITPEALYTGKVVVGVLVVGFAGYKLATNSIDFNQFMLVATAVFTFVGWNEYKKMNDLKKELEKEKEL